MSPWQFIQRIMVLFTVLGTFVICGALIHASFAHEVGKDANAQWFQSLKAPTGIKCCDLDKDCHQTDQWAVKNNHYAVKIGNEWVVVADENVLHIPNPTGMAVECHSPVKGFDAGTLVRCFVPAAAA